MNPAQQPSDDQSNRQQFQEMNMENASIEDSDSEKPSKRSGRRKIKIEYIEDKNRRHITFSKRKAGIMKKAYELSTLTGTQVLLLVVSETGLVYTFTTVKLQPIVTKPEGKNLIQACLNAPDPVPGEPSSSSDLSTSEQHTSPRLEKEEKKPMDTSYLTTGATTSRAAATTAYQPAVYAAAGGPQMPGSGYPGFMSSAHAAQFPAYGPVPPSPFYGGQHQSQQAQQSQPQAQQPQQPYAPPPSHYANYWQGSANSIRDSVQSNDKTRPMNK